MTQGEWEKSAGDVCPGCNRPALRFFATPKGRVCGVCRKHETERLAKLEARLRSVSSLNPAMERRVARYLKRRGL